MSNQVLQDLFEDLDAVSSEERTRLKQKLYLSLYGSSSKPLRRTKQQILEDLQRAGEICYNFRRQL